VYQSNAYPYDLFNNGDLGFSRAGLEHNDGGNLFSGYFNSTYPGFVRKVQSDFGWDWGIALVPCGIWGNIRLVKGGKHVQFAVFCCCFFQRNVTLLSQDMWV